ncbi:TadE/TadG family type IV pilus assembly protein [Paremcibacter congregatus]|uniref:TadE/TadG family type IV pilus assembly protein n=1 Tax=Paremcibacter congregatus TaxID=2043170 RepID=UPI0030EEAEFA|tara:strand:+ start:13828 stop:14469 length:642 start_codon:yes stop_codon:yes gene_type:complete
MRQKNNTITGGLQTFLRRLRQHQSGAVLIESAFVIPVIALATIGTLEVGVTMLSIVMLEGAISEASRAGMTGATENGQTREQYINDLLKEKTFGMIDLNNLVITQKVYEEFADVGTPEPFADNDGDGIYSPGVDAYTDINCNDKWDNEVGKNGAGGPGEVVMYKAVYDANFMTGYFSHMIGDDDGKMQLSASTVIQNEPYGTPPPGCVVEVKM